MDTTYINCTREEFPSREASSAKICSVLRELLFDGSKPVAIMVPKIGREQLLVDIAIEFKVGILIACTAIYLAFLNFMGSIPEHVDKKQKYLLLFAYRCLLQCKIWIDYIRFQVAEILGLSEYFTTEKAETSIWTCTRR